MLKINKERGGRSHYGIDASLEALGYEEGKAEGIEEGKAEGKAEGKEEGQAELIRKLLLNGFSPEAVSKAVEMPLDKIKKLM
ncbi:transposase [Paenibacillus sp. FSL R7-277]|uniref:hypothetical protein n=1 Tax=Paenibacillus sp. FSL R7-277 TaxID=1227352 RepID=UPI0003E25EC7|nr:hypothetical protein [Paenibacillus sp. FSL R7-277]ETT58910.1 transposase [Paenibacillus sp. FSL R7-277]